MKYKTLIAVSLCALIMLSACGSKESVSSIDEQGFDETVMTNDIISNASVQVSASSDEKENETSYSTESDTQNLDVSTENVSSKSEKDSDSSKIPDTDSEKAEKDDSDTSSEIINSKNMTPVCRSALVYCIDDDELLYEDSVNDTVAPASLTKLLTAAVVLEYLNPDFVVTVGTEQDLVAPESSKCYIEIGNQLTVHDLLTGMLLCSGNDAAYTAAVATARADDPELSAEEAVEHFVELMNDLASAIGMKDSHFAVPDGLDDPNQYTTALDLSKLAAYTLDIPEIKGIVGTYNTNVTIESGESFDWFNTNQLIDPNSTYYREDAIGMKTGTTDAAGCCLISAAQKDGKTYISVVTGCYSDLDRFELSDKLFDLFT